MRYRRRLDKVYTRLGRMLAAGAVRPEVDPIDPDVSLPPAACERIAVGHDQLGRPASRRAAAAPPAP